MFIRAILAAGHDTVSNTLSWMFLEMARNPTIQTRLRREIRSAEQSVRLRGDSEFTLADCEAMTYLNAFIKVNMTILFVDVILTCHEYRNHSDSTPLVLQYTAERGEMKSYRFRNLLSRRPARD